MFGSMFGVCVWCVCACEDGGGGGNSKAGHKDVNSLTVTVDS